MLQASHAVDAEGPTAELHPAWALLLQRPCIHQHQQLLCSLLMVSNTLCGAISESCMGRMPCTLKLSDPDPDSNPWLVKLTAATSQRMAQFTSWVAKHGLLLRSLDLEVPVESPETAALVDALQQAATTSPRGLQLQSFRGSTCPALLQQLPSNHLTSLSLLAWSNDIEECEATTTTRDSIARLTRLQRLTLFEEEGVNANLLAPALPGLTQLTYLAAGLTRQAGLTQHLPVQLRELHIGAYSGAYDESWDPEVGEQEPGEVQLGHLTALTRLQLVREVPVELQAKDVLPPNTQTLHLRHIPTADLLLPLQQLRVLDMYSFTMLPAADLQKLSSLEHLESVSFVYRTGSCPDAAAAGWRALPITRLELHADISASTLQHLGALLTLTSLRFCHIRWGATQQELAAVLQHLTALQELEVGSLEFLHEGLMDGGAGIRAIVQALSGLRDLRSLELRRLPFHSSAAATLAAATQLTKLALSLASLEDYTVVAIACNLTNLVSLDLRGNDVSDVVMPAIAKLQLTYLDLCHTRVSDTGLGWITSLQLREVGLCGTAVSAALKRRYKDSSIVCHCRPSWV